MRTAVLAGLALAALPAAAAAQQPFHAVVETDEVIVRAGPSDKYPETGTLPRGTKLLIDHEDQNRWLAVANPPAAVSWVMAVRVKFDADEVRPFPRNATVTADAADLLPGRVGHPGPLAGVRRSTVKKGDVLTVIGQKVTEPDGKSWYPVMALDDDFRYVPRSAVRFEKAANTSFVVRGEPSGVAPAGAVGSPPVDGPPDGKPAPAVGHPLWAKAEAADQANRYDEAEQLYYQIARESTGPDQDTANLCYSRIHGLRERKRGGGTAVAASGGREALVPNTGRTPVPPETGGSRPPITDPNPPRVGAALLPPVRADGGPAAPPPAAAAAGWSAGKLVRSALVIDNQTAYGLETSPGITKLYVLPGRGVDLRSLVNRRVEVYGTPQTRRDVAKPVVVAADVREGQ